MSPRVAEHLIALVGYSLRRTAIGDSKTLWCERPVSDLMPSLVSTFLPGFGDLPWLRTPALNAPSIHSVSPRRAESLAGRSRRRFSTRGRRSVYQGLSPSRSLALSKSRIGSSTVLSAANIHVIARARVLISAGNRPAWRSEIWRTIAPLSNRQRSPSSSALWASLIGDLKWPARIRFVFDLTVTQTRPRGSTPRRFRTAPSE